MGLRVWMAVMYARVREGSSGMEEGWEGGGLEAEEEGREERGEGGGLEEDDDMWLQQGQWRMWRPVVVGVVDERNGDKRARRCMRSSYLVVV